MQRLFWWAQCNICSDGHNATFVLVGIMQHLFWWAQNNISSGGHNAKTDPREMPDSKIRTTKPNLPKCMPCAKPEEKTMDAVGDSMQN